MALWSREAASALCPGFSSAWTKLNPGKEAHLGRSCHVPQSKAEKKQTSSQRGHCGRCFQMTDPRFTPLTPGSSWKYRAEWLPISDGVKPSSVMKTQVQKRGCYPITDLSVPEQTVPSGTNTSDPSDLQLERLCWRQNQELLVVPGANTGSKEGVGRKA